MNGYNFTERVRKVLAMAREEAARLHHQYVGPQHILLGIIREGEGVAVAVLQNLGVDLDDVRQKVELMVEKGKTTEATGPDLPYTSRAKKALELSMREARELKHSYVGTEHLMLGLVADEKSPAGAVLHDAGITLALAREETKRLLGPELERAAPPRGAPPRKDTLVAVPTEDEAQERLVRASLHLAMWRKRQAEAQLLEERVAWMRLRQAINICRMLGREPALEAHTDGNVRVTLGDGVVVAIALPGLVTG